MPENDLPRVVPRMAPEGVIPLIAVEGTAYDCGREYAEIVLRKYPGFRDYLDLATRWQDLPSLERRLIEQRAPFLMDVHRGLFEVAGRAAKIPQPPDTPEAIRAAAAATAAKAAKRGKARKPRKGGGCTSFALSGSVTLDGRPITGQTKDTGVDRIPRYIVLRMRIKGGPTILTLCYPGEVLGYGMWSTGMSQFRNTLWSSAGMEKGLDFMILGLLCLAGKTVHEGAELALKYGRRGAGNQLLADANGDSLSIESNIGGVNILPAKDGICTHANHPFGPDTSKFEEYPVATFKADSEVRTFRLWDRFNADRGRLTPQRTLQLIADHSTYPRGTCKHYGEDGGVTTAVVVCEPTLGKLHAVRGQPCCNWPVTYAV